MFEVFIRLLVCGSLIGCGAILIFVGVSLLEII